MDPFPTYTGFHDYTTGAIIDEQNPSPNSQQYPDFQNGFKFDMIPSPGINFMENPFEHPESFVTSSSLSPDGGSSSCPSSGWSLDGVASSSSEEYSDYTDPVLKYISQMLLEENTEDSPPMIHNPSALKATVKSLYEVIGVQYPASLNSPRPYKVHDEPGACVSRIVTVTGTDIASGTSSNAVDHPGIGDNGESSTSLSHSSIYNGLLGSSVKDMVPNTFTHDEYVLQFQRGLEEASKYLPSPNKLLVVGSESNTFATLRQKEGASIEGQGLMNGSSRGRKNREREDSYLKQERSVKQSAVHVEESDLSEQFDKVLLWGGENDPPSCRDHEREKGGETDTSQQNEPSHRSSSGRTSTRKPGKEKETIDLRTLLILCAQAVSSNDFRTANELLKQIRQHSSSLGDGSQRLAHIFANGIEARLTGSGIQVFYNSPTTKSIKTADILKAYKAHLYSCPFKKLSILFSNEMIYKAAEKAATLHLIDFGILYGFQWPILIHKLSMRPGGPPKLRITAIELPQQGFRPAERIEESGRRLAKYCERFHVPFEYIPIAAQNWEKIPIEELGIHGNEVLAVNCLYRFQHLLDETVEANNCPRNAVLDLIRKVNPDIFVHTIINGTYNAPFFVTRFREAVFHFSSVFDMFDSILPRESHERLMLEQEFYGRDAMNTIACEGMERVDRSETYKQWQARTIRAGFKQLPLDQELMKICSKKMKTLYHKNFVIDEDSKWMLQGWKGRIIYASSAWVTS